MNEAQAAAQYQINKDLIRFMKATNAQFDLIMKELYILKAELENVKKRERDILAYIKTN